MKKLLTLACSGLFALNLGTMMAQPYPSGNGYMQQPMQQTSMMPSISWLRNYSEALNLSQSSSKPIAILFTGTSWCPACIKLEREVLANPAFTQAVGQKFVFLKAEFPDYSEGSVAASPYKSLMDRYNVVEFPTIVVVNPNGQQLYTINYRPGGAQFYAQELLQKLNQSGF